MGEIACVSASYDEYYRTENKTRCRETKHYSECSEFARQEYLNRVQKISLKKRISIPYKTKAILQQEINSKCPFCSNTEVAYFESHHIDENPSNNNIDNLIMICKICHSKITKGDISLEKVKKAKEKLSTNKQRI